MSARPLSRMSYTTWRQIDDGRPAIQAEWSLPSLREIEAHYSAAPHHGDTIFVLEQELFTGSQMLHAYRIRRGKWNGGYSDGHAKTYHYHADKLFAMPVAAFAPAEPWRWSPGCDVVGRDACLTAIPLTSPEGTSDGR